MTENKISFEIRGAIYNVYNELGPGLLESVYEAALMYELRKKGLEPRQQVEIPVYYDNKKLGVGFRMDILVNDKVIIEIKSVANLIDVHHLQVLTYLKLSDKRLGILVNFNVASIDTGIFRKVNGLVE